MMPMSEITHHWTLICGKAGECSARELGTFEYRPPRADLASVYAGLTFRPAPDGRWRQSVYGNTFDMLHDARSHSYALAGVESFSVLGEMGGVNPFERRAKHEIGCRVCGANFEVGRGKWESLARALVTFAGHAAVPLKLSDTHRAYSVALRM